MAKISFMIFVYNYTYLFYTMFEWSYCGLGKHQGKFTLSLLVIKFQFWELYFQNVESFSLISFLIKVWLYIPKRPLGMNEIVLSFVFADFSNKISKKPKKVCKVKDEWFFDSEYKFFLQKQPKITEHSLYCTLCSKDINKEHQGWVDFTRHINGNAHKEAQEAKRKQPEIDSIFLKPSNPLESQVRRMEVEVTGFIAEHNILLAVADIWVLYSKTYFTIQR